MPIRQSICHVVAPVLISALLIPAPILGSTLVVSSVRDVIYEPDGGPFNGTITLEPANFDDSNPPVMVTQIYDGLLSIRVVPTTIVPLGAFYTVTYSSSKSSTRWIEIWRVAASDRLSLKDVRSLPGKLPSASPTGKSDESPNRDLALPIPLADVSGLASDLSQINITISKMVTITAGLATTAQSLTARQQIRGEVPSGLTNGVNTTFTLANAPLQGSISLSLNGIRLQQGVDYSLSGRTITALPGTVPRSGSIFQADYAFTTASAPLSKDLLPRSVSLPIALSGVAGLPVALSTINNSLASMNNTLVSLSTALSGIIGAGMAVGEIPTGALNGINAGVTLANSPSPSNSLALYRNGVRLMSSVDYTANGSSITFANGAIPKAGDLLQADYTFTL